MSRADSHNVISTNLMYTGPCIVIYSYGKTNRMHQCIKFISFGVTLYMFQTDFPFIISSSRLYIQQPNRYCYQLAGKQKAVSV